MMGGKRAGLLGVVVGLVLTTGSVAWAGQAFLASGPVLAETDFDSVVAAGDLGKERAGDFIVTGTTTQTQTATQSGNSANGNGGDVNIAGSVDGMHGIGLVVANSGNLGVAQGNLIMNVYLGPAPSNP